MKSSAFPRIAITLLLVLLLSGQSYTGDDLDSAFGTGTLVISASEHACYRFDIWIAVSNREHARGLMHVRKLPEDAGMLFIYTESKRLSMWMKNTYIPLDMLFIRRDGTVSSVLADTEPLSLKSLSSIEPVTYVLELNAGTTNRLKISPDNQLLWSQDLGD